MRTDKMTLMVQDNNRKRQANNREALNTRLRYIWLSLKMTETFITWLMTTATLKNKYVLN